MTAVHAASGLGPAAIWVVETAYPVPTDCTIEEQLDN